MNRRLYQKLYLTFLGITVLSLLVAAFLARAFHEPRIPAAHTLEPLARSLVCETPGSCRGVEAQQIEAKARELDADVVVWDGDGRLLLHAGRGPLPLGSAAGWQYGPRGPVWLTQLGDGRTLGVRERGHVGPRRPLFLPLLVVLAVLMAIGLHPLSRSITRRLEQLAEGARRWGAGDLGHRVPVVGHDEIATLAERFNQTAAAIEALLAQERQMLAGASHELRSPLARIRMALELLADESDPVRRGELARRAGEDIVELDALVEELLLSARAQPGVPRRPSAKIDLLALVREEAQAVGAQVTGEPLLIHCEGAMLRHMVRNLFTNARLHGAGGAIRAEVRRVESQALIAVEDDGPGVPESERERIFAPFYRPPRSPMPGDTGLGLGLALVRQVARYHAGDVAYIARQPTGSRFEVRLPVSPSTTLSAA
ncbi:MAG TPA: HAMP domain-containing sensor histidine kinase [Polyangia bacterium]|jgi:Signal transduction histidine kinase|nr:HAMP domain-containing sensor histidine kinase [Polyangia bacterium]